MDTLAGLLTHFETAHPQKIDLGLESVYALLENLGNPHLKCPPVVHVAGTNGKGSTIAFLKAMVTAAGYTVHCYTSPHLISFHERINLAGQPINDDLVLTYLQDVYKASKKHPVTYFEATTAAAFLAFAQTPADLLLLETGLGGRLDATNVIPHPLITVITPISWDHQSFLGDTLIKIAAEKAGIFKKGTPAVIAPQPEDVLTTLLEKAQTMGVPVFAAGQDWHVTLRANGFVYKSAEGAQTFPLPVLQGPHQIINAATAIATTAHLKGFDVPLKALTAGLNNAHWPGRFQQVGKEIYVDGGHNVAAAHALAATLASLPAMPTQLVLGMKSDKDLTGFIGVLAPHCTTVYAVCGPATDSHAPDKIAEVAVSLGLKGAAYDSLTTALAAAQHNGGRTLICGSLYLAGEALGLLQQPV